MSKLSGVRYCCFHDKKEMNCIQKLFVFRGNSYLYTEPVLLWKVATGIQADSCLLKPIHGYPDSHSYQREVVNPALLEESHITSRFYQNVEWYQGGLCLVEKRQGDHGFQQLQQHTSHDPWAALRQLLLQLAALGHRNVMSGQVKHEPNGLITGDTLSDSGTRHYYCSQQAEIRIC